MLNIIPEVLTPEEVAQAQERLAAAQWIDGRATAGHQSARVKRNQQLAEDSAEAREIGEIVLRALQRNALFITAALPRQVFPPLFNRYETGMEFGPHVDNAVRQIPGTPHRLRTDLSATLFLNSPQDYDGGELLIEEPSGTRSIKLRAGHMVLYPATHLHRISNVTRGARIASFFWIQSMVKDVGERDLLFNLDRTIVSLGESDPNQSALPALTSIYHNLIRKWGEI